ncbi:MAG TPA: hypothetical protein V6C81_05725 [Planktothrix sp.]|jgi:hypothetical protein
MARLRLSAALFSALFVLVGAQAAYCDAISPSIKEATDDSYSKEKPDSTFYGTGTGSHLTEASVLRFQGEQDMDNHEWDAAIRKLSKAVQLDAAEPEGHVLYARALTRKIEAGQNVTPEMVQMAQQEWKLLWHHDSDYLEQIEAKNESRRLSRVAKMLEKQDRMKQVKAQVASSEKTH